MPAQRTAIATLGATLAALIAVSHPTLIPAMSITLIVWAALALYMKL